MNKPIFRLVTIWLAVILVLTACGGGGNEGGETTGGEDNANKDKPPIKIGQNAWAENIAISNMWKILLEEKGYEAEITSTEKGPLFAGIAENDLDVALELWLPTTDKPYYEEYKEGIDVHEEWYKGTNLGIVVPSYMDIDSIEQLNDIKAKTEGEIIGISPGTSIMGLAKKVIKEYGLDYELVSGSDPAMMGEVERSTADKEPVVVTLWNPHWAWARYDLKYLKDPKNVFGDPENIYWMSRKGFEEDYPEVTKMFNSWTMNNKQLGDLMAIINEEGDAAAGAKKWIEANRDLVDKWLSGKGGTDTGAGTDEGTETGDNAGGENTTNEEGTEGNNNEGQ